MELKLLDWAMAFCGALLTLLYGVHERRQNATDKRIDEIEDAMPSQFERDELARQRLKHEEHIKRIFEKLEGNERVASDRHIELLEKLAAKADR